MSIQIGGINYRIPFAGGDECDALSIKSRRFFNWNAGVRNYIKRKYRRRVRRRLKHKLKGIENGQ